MKHDPLIIPALRGAFGDWIYYAGLMRIFEVRDRVRYAHEVHPDKALSQLIQRSLEGPRAKHIAGYLASTKERFFNSLVLATYGGNPEWLEVGNFQSTTKPEIVQQVSADAIDRLGFLRLSGAESIFAIDGQHRLAGIQRALTDGVDIRDELVPIIMVGHKKDAAGLQRTRRLFTALNKTAVPVRKRDIIALDEDDVMAIVARRLVETHSYFRDPKIAVIASQNIPTGNRTCLTTISSLYDTLKLLFKFEIGQRTDRTLRFNRPSDARLEQHFAFALEYFSALGKAFKPVGDLFSASDPTSVTKKHRRPSGGHLIFRPIGLDVVTDTAIEFAKANDLSLPHALDKIKHLPTDLENAPYSGVIWDPTRRRVVGRGKGVVRDLIRYMVGLPVETDSLLARYKHALGVEPSEKIKLPEIIVT